METGQMLELVKKFQENKEFIQNEETVKVALVLPFIRMLGYDPTSPREVRPEFSADFTQGDGKRLPDRMDFAIFDKAGVKPLMVVETKPPNTDLRSKSQQLARYIAQLPDLHFGVITDGCSYLFYGDLENPNQMDKEPFFSFSLDDPQADWTKIAKFLSKFSRDTFNAETLVTDAENSRYRQEMIDRLASALRNPGDDEGFLSWITQGVYRGKRTAGVMSRLADVAREAVEPALVRLMSDDFLNKLKERIQNAGRDRESEPSAPNVVSGDMPASLENLGAETRKGIETTKEELDFFENVRSICAKNGFQESDILYRDTINYFNVSFQRPTRWFLRFFGSARRKCIVSLVPVEEARQLAGGFETEVAPDTFGVSRVYFDDIAQLWAMTGLVLRSLEIARSGPPARASEESSAEVSQA